MTQDYITQSIRSSAILTGAYVAGTILGLAASQTQEIYLQNQLLLYVDFTKGNLTDGRIKIEFSCDNVNYYQETNTSTPTAGVVDDSVFEHRYLASGAYRLAIPLKDKFVKISAKGTGADPPNSLMALNAVIGVVYSLIEPRMSSTVSDIKSGLNGIMHGTTNNQIVGLNTLIDRSARRFI